MYGLIYKVTNLINNKIYIGQTTRSFNRRKIEHINQALHPETYKRKPCRYFHAALVKYGLENFKWEILFECKTKEELNNKEIYLIKEFNSYGKNGYNLSIGGDSNAGYKHSIETRERMKKHKHTKESKEKLSKSHSGKKLSQITKDKLRIINTGIKKSQEQREKAKIYLKGKGVKKVKCSNGIIYNSITEAATLLNLHISKISNVCKGKRKHTGGLSFEYTN